MIQYARNRRAIPSRLQSAVKSRILQRDRLVIFDEAGCGSRLRGDDIPWAINARGALQRVGEVGDAFEINEVARVSVW